MTVLIDHDGPVTIVTIDRPAKRNAVDPDTAIALRDAFTAFAKDDSARIAILTGSAGHFCAGFDLGAVGTSRYDPDGPGGCNVHGCWNSPLGACNVHGCSDRGACSVHGCP